jgi:HEPN domain-containing protein
MPPAERYGPDDPREWLRQARVDLAMARAEVPGVDAMEPFCFHAQQSAEKAIKALLLHRGIRFPHVHDLDRLLVLLSDHGVEAPDTVREADRLSEYAVLTRYPLDREPVTVEQRREAVEIAETVLRWTEHLISHSSGA